MTTPGSHYMMSRALVPCPVHTPCEKKVHAAAWTRAWAPVQAVQFLSCHTEGHCSISHIHLLVLLAAALALQEVLQRGVFMDPLLLAAAILPGCCALPRSCVWQWPTCTPHTDVVHGDLKSSNVLL